MKKTEPGTANGAPDSYTDQIAHYASTFRYDCLPLPVQAQARAITLDTLGAMLAASSPRYDAGRILGRVVDDQGGTPHATIVGRATKTASINAALINATFGYYCDIESHHPGAIMHGAAIVLPAALAIAESRGLSGADLLGALVLGIDVACRVSYAIGPNALYARGFHPSAICGAFGAAAAAGNLLRLDPERMANAFGLASTQAAGLLAWSSDPTEQSRPFNPGIAARNGVTAALLAEAGFGAPQRIFDPTAKYNVYRAWSDTAAPEMLVDALHTRYFIMELAIKLYSCCAFLHPALDGILALVGSGVVPQQVDAITLRFARSGTAIIDNNPLRSHCAQYILPIGLIRQHILIDDILTDRRDDPRIADLSHRVLVVPDDALEQFYPDRYPSIVELHLRGGGTVQERVDWPRGYPQNPVSAEELTEKFLGLAGGTIGQTEAARLAALIGQIETLAPLDELVSLIAGPGK
ncbi:MAG: MmgE/PrpD family protein [Thermomicrobiales bacterium]